MSDIVTEVAKAIERADTDIHVSYQDLARAAIEAYEAANCEDGELYRELVGGAYPTQTHEQRMESHRAANKAMHDALTRLAERKP